MSLRAPVSDSALTMGLYTSKRGEEVVWEEMISPNQLSRCCQISQHHIWQMHTYKNILYTLCTTMMNGKELIMLIIMKKLLAHFGKMER